MSLVCFVPEDNEKYRVTLIHHRPDELPDEIRKACVMVDKVPKPDFSQGGIAIPYIDLETKTVYYEYFNGQEESEV